MASTTPVISGTVQATEKSFESNTKRLFAAKEGESTFKKVAAIIVGIVPAALYDLVRLGLFYTNLIDGKSFSLIDKASDQLQSLSNRIGAVWENYKNPSLATLNERSEAVLKAKAKNLVSAYIGLDRNFFNQTKNSFGSLDEQKVQKAHSELLKAIEEHLKINIDANVDAASFDRQATSVKQLVEKFIEEAAEGEFYITKKAIRHPDQKPLPLANVIKAALNGNFEATKGERFAAVVNTPRFVSVLSEKVEQNKIDAEQAKTALSKHLHTVFSNSLKTVGLKGAGEAVSKLVQDAVLENIVTQEESTELAQAVTAPAKELAIGVAKDLVKEAPIQTNELLNESKILDAAGELIQTKKLTNDQKLVFCSAAKNESIKMRDQIAAEKRAYAELNREITNRMAKIAAAKELADEQEKAVQAAAKAAEEKKAKEAEEAAKKKAEAEAAAVAAIQKRDLSFNKLKALLEIVVDFGKKRSEAVANYTKVKEKFDLEAQEIAKLKDQTISVKMNSSKSMRLLQASAFYHDKVSGINQHYTNPLDRQRKLDELDNSDRQTVSLIEELEKREAQAKNLTKEQVQLWGNAIKAHEDYSRLASIYASYTKGSELKGFDESQKMYLQKGADLLKEEKRKTDAAGPRDLTDAMKSVSLTEEEQKNLDDLVNALIAAHKAPIAIPKAPITTKAGSSEPKDKTDSTVEQTPKNVSVAKDYNSQNPENALGTFFWDEEVLSRLR